MPERSKPRKKVGVGDEALSALKHQVGRRMINSAERTSLVGKVQRLLSGAIGCIDNLVRSRPRWQRDPISERAIRLFGLDRPDSSLMKPRLEWKMSLKERVATETLAKLLNAGAAHVRSLRVEAFLRAVGLRDAELGCGGLKSAQVFSEVAALAGGRIDLKFRWLDAREHEHILVVEAKFEHTITDGQLRSYRDTARQAHPRARLHCLVLGLNENSMLSVRRRRDGHWRFCSWRDMWLRFEAARPVEDDLSLQLFLHALWRRIGQLNPKDAYAAL